MDRREFIKSSVGGAAALAVGSHLPSWILNNEAYAATQTLNFTLTDAVKGMINDQPGWEAKCYFWLFKSTAPDIAAEVPGPTIFAFEGDTININLSNALPQSHRFAVPALQARFPGAGPFTSPTMGPGTLASPTSTSFSFTLPAGSAGSYLYYDDLNAPVNRMMGLHGALIVMPNPATGTPYSTSVVAANPRMAQLFADLGTAPWWPGLAWDEEGVNPAPYPNTPPFRQYIWVLHEPSSLLFNDVGIFSFANPGTNYPAAIFVDRFLNDPLVVIGNANTPPLRNNTPDYFTINGMSGHFSHNTPYITPHLRVGEPCMIRILNAGMWTHSMHLHANHYYLMAMDNRLKFLPGQQDNHPWLDVVGVRPLATVDWLIPYMRPPDIPNTLGIGRADLADPLPVDPTPITGFGIVHVNGQIQAGDTPEGVTTWPPEQEMHMAIPPVGTTAGLPIHVPLSPLCFPMHDHSEPSQTAQGGNYNQGMIAGMNFTGDRNADDRLGEGVLTFPDAPEQYGPDPNVSPQQAAGPEPPWPHVHIDH
jgi:FtsP/CotA-like multicopper oxidase with cupredoxin domain